MNRICTFQQMRALKFTSYCDSFSAILGVTRARGSRPKMTKCDMGKRGSKISKFWVTYFLNGLLALKIENAVPFVIQTIKCKSQIFAQIDNLRRHLRVRVLAICVQNNPLGNWGLRCKFLSWLPLSQTTHHMESCEGGD